MGNNAVDLLTVYQFSSEIYKQPWLILGKQLMRFGCFGGFPPIYKNVFFILRLGRV